MKFLITIFSDSHCVPFFCFPLKTFKVLLRFQGLKTQT